MADVTIADLEVWDGPKAKAKERIKSMLIVRLRNIGSGSKEEAKKLIDIQTIYNDKTGSDEPISDELKDILRADISTYHKAVA
jgi:hypothetical protein